MSSRLLGVFVLPEDSFDYMRDDCKHIPCSVHVRGCSTADAFIPTVPEAVWTNFQRFHVRMDSDPFSIRAPRFRQSPVR